MVLKKMNFQGSLRNLGEFEDDQNINTTPSSRRGAMERHGAGAGAHNQLTPTITLTASGNINEQKGENLNRFILDLERVIKRAQAPLVEEMKTMTKKVKVELLALFIICMSGDFQMTDMSKQMTRVENIVNTMDKKNKQILEAVDKVHDTPEMKMQ